MSDSPSTIAIVGGGIGGLTCALALANVGIKSIVFERFNDDADVGAGIQLSPNATRILFQLGLEHDLNALGRTSTMMEWLDGKTDKSLARFPILKYVTETFDSPYLQIYRPDLINLLKSKCSESSDIDFRPGVSIEGLVQETNGITLQTSSSATHVDLCIGADGTVSTIRKYTTDAFEQRKFAGFAYRAVIPLDRLHESFSFETTLLWLDSAFHVVTYTVGTPPILNCVFVTESDSTEQHGEIHRQRSSRNALATAIREPSPRLQMLLERVPDGALYRWPIYQFPPVPAGASSERPIVLIGDAWHTTLPFAGQGAALAIEDAEALATCMADTDLYSLGDRLSRFEAKRAPRIRQVQAISTRNRVVYHLKNPVLKLLRSWCARPAYWRTTKQLFGYVGNTSS